MSRTIVNKTMCNCGHVSFNHFNDTGFCYFGPEFRKFRPDCECLKFTRDNLLYLEKQYEQNNVQ